MFEHSIKVPRHYKVAANIFKKVSTEGGSVKTLLYDNKLRHFRTKSLYALLTETIKHSVDIDKIFETSNILKNEPRLDPWLAKVLTAELLFGKKIFPGNSKPEHTVYSYKEQFEKYIAEHQDDLKTEVVPRPRYVRINTNLLSTSDAIRAFQDEGYRFIRCTSASYNDYLTQIQNLTEYDFTQDYHIKTLFVFASGTKFHEHELYLENNIILQDKATALAVHLLSPPSGSVVLDMCAAPGMKTTQLAAYMRNEGKIYAVERNEKRYETLYDFVNKSGSKCVETIHKDALEIKKGDYDDVEYILLDPSCSGSGMELSVHNYIEDTRLAKLTSLQEKFLKHAMNSFPKAKRIVYSTCSIFPEENERVVTNVVKTSRSKWRVQDVKELLKGQWNNFGSGMYGSIGTRCLYAKSESDFTTGFFVAVLDRDQKSLETNLNNEESNKNEGKTKKDKTKNNGVEEHTMNGTYNESTEKLKNKLKSKKENVEGSQKEDLNEINSEVVIKKKNKKKNKNKEVDESKDSVNVPVEVTENQECIKKKKKRKRQDNDENQSVEDIAENSVEIIKKKKKKTKNSEESADNEPQTITDNIDGDISDLPKKKKKKKRDKHEVTEA